MPRAPGRLVAGGDPAAADALAAALRAPAADHDIAESLTHPFHSYPARLHPATARVLVEFVGAPAVRDAMRRLCRALDLHGLVGGQFMMDPRTGSPLLIAARAHGCGVHSGLPMLSAQLELMLDFMGVPPV